jgi:hypothetical protein
VNPDLNPNAPQTTYAFNGFRRISSPGRIAGDDGASAEFQEMGKLEQSHDWNGLIKIAEAQMKERPEWLTPYALAGEAYLQLGQNSKALELLETAKKRIAGNPDYAPLQKPLGDMLGFLRSP